MPAVRVVIADDHPIVRAGIRDILDDAEDIDVIGEAATGPEALAEVEEKHPDVLLLDVELPGYSGVEVARRLQTDSVATRLLALSSYDDSAYVRGLLERGASGYLTKENAPNLIVEAVRAVADGEVRWFVTPGEVNGHPDDLTPQERTVLARMAEGRSNGDIADVLNVTTSTVRSHLTSIYRKLGVDSSREAIAWAWKQGLLDPAQDTD